MAKLFGRYLAIYNKDISPKYTKIAKVGLKFYQINHQKFENSQKWQNLGQIL